MAKLDDTNETGFLLLDLIVSLMSLALLTSAMTSTLLHLSKTLQETQLRYTQLFTLQPLIESLAAPPQSSGITLHITPLDDTFDIYRYSLSSSLFIERLAAKQ